MYTPKCIEETDNKKISLEGVYLSYLWHVSLSEGDLGGRRPKHKFAVKMLYLSICPCVSLSTCLLQINVENNTKIQQNLPTASSW